MERQINHGHWIWQEATQSSAIRQRHHCLHHYFHHHCLHFSWESSACDRLQTSGSSANQSKLPELAFDILHALENDIQLNHSSIGGRIGFTAILDSVKAFEKIPGLSNGSFSFLSCLAIDFSADPSTFGHGLLHQCIDILISRFKHSNVDVNVVAVGGHGEQDRLKIREIN